MVLNGIWNLKYRDTNVVKYIHTVIYDSHRSCIRNQAQPPKTEVPNHAICMHTDANYTNLT